MSRLALVNGLVMTPDGPRSGVNVIIEDEQISEVTPAHRGPDGERVYDATGCTIAPGFIDVHVHGGAGHDTMDATPEALHGMATFFASHGVTSFLPTTVAADHAALLAAIANVSAYTREARDGARVLGIHLEGPYLSHMHPGAQPVAHFREALPAEYHALFAANNVRLISLAPEVKGTLALIAYAVEKGATVAVGHSAATYDQVMAAVTAGLSQACHTFNGMSGLHHRRPGVAGAVLTCDNIFAQVIVDLIHLHPAVVKLLVRAKGVERIVLITDAMRAAGLPDGDYELAGQQVSVSAGQVRLTHGDSLAGSTLTMDTALRNIMRATGLTLAEALPMATSVPAQSLGLGHELGAIKPGFVADLVLLDADLTVRATIVRGALAYQSAS